MDSYHQKYMLRQERQLLSALKLSDAELIKSTTAAKLNGYGGGFGTLENFEAVSSSKWNMTFSVIWYILV